MKTVRLVGRCPVCSEAVRFSRRACLRCDAQHHEECWEYNRGCGIYGCQVRPAAAPVLAAGSQNPVEVPWFLTRMWLIALFGLNVVTVLMALLCFGGL